MDKNTDIDWDERRYQIIISLIKNTKFDNSIGVSHYIIYSADEIIKHMKDKLKEDEWHTQQIDKLYTRTRSDIYRPRFHNSRTKSTEMVLGDKIDSRNGGNICTRNISRWRILKSSI